MAIIPAQQTLTAYNNLAVPLPRYFQLIQNTECSGYGVSDPDNPEPGCRQIWTKFQRDETQRYLAEAQEEIEQQIGFTMTPRWFTDENHSFVRCNLGPIITDWGKVIAGGIRGESNIALATAIDQTNDPAIVGPIATTVTDTNEIRVFHPDTDVEIIPSSVIISGGNVTIQIPRCRTVLAALADNPEEGWEYGDLANFETTVDVKRVFNDTSVNAELVWPRNCRCSLSGCTDHTETACIYVRKPEIGSVDVRPASYTDGSWVGTRFPCWHYGSPEFVRLNYYAGQQVVTRQMEDTIIRLAHSKMPDEFCGCDVWTRLWRRDRNIPEVLTRERLNNPFGLSDGSWIAFTFTRQFRLNRGDTL